MAETSRESNSGKTFFGDKNRSFLERMSKSVVEKGNDFTVLYFEVDYPKSKRNFYGELIVRAWVNPLGIKVKGIIDLEEGNDLQQGDIPNKLMTLKFGCYVSHLKELGIDPKRGDYFATKNRIYYIYDISIADANSVSIATDQQSMVAHYSCVQADDEQLIAPGLQDNVGTKNEIEGTSQTDGLSIL